MSNGLNNRGVAAGTITSLAVFMLAAGLGGNVTASAGGALLAGLLVYAIALGEPL